MKRMHSYWLSSAVVATIAFAGFAIAQQKMSMPDAAPVAPAPDAAAVVAPASAPQLDNAAIQALPIGAERGRIIAMQPGACFTCHSGTGDSVIPANPKLAGQHEAYLEKQLHDFKVAEGAEKALLETDRLLFEEAPIYDASFRKQSESGTTRLVRCCSKASF